MVAPDDEMLTCASNIVISVTRYIFENHIASNPDSYFMRGYNFTKQNKMKINKGETQEGHNCQICFFKSCRGSENPRFLFPVKIEFLKQKELEKGRGSDLFFKNMRGLTIPMKRNSR